LIPRSIIPDDDSDDDDSHKIQKSKTKNVQVIFHKQHQKLYQSYA